MSTLGLLKTVAGNMLDIKKLQLGADIMINNHVDATTLYFPSHVRKQANELVKNYYLSRSHNTFNECDAAMMKLALYFRVAEETEQEKVLPLIGNCISKIRQMHDGSICPDISLIVRGETGY